VDRGTKVGPYEILERLGAGGMGEVYKGRDTRLGRFVAIKMLRPELASDDERTQWFIREAKAASALNHPNIITVYDVTSESGRDFLVMEYVQGKSLDALIRRTRMRLSEVLRIAIQVADGLRAAHDVGIIHRDLKPSNIMVSDTGDVKILDFGLAKLTLRAKPTESDETLPLDALSLHNMVLGTPAYMSPEQATGGPVDARTDIFSFGAVLYEMATGRRAFSGTSTAATVAAVLGSSPPAPIELVPGIPVEFDRIVMRCLRRDPARRHQHMTDVKVLLEDLKEECESEKLPAGRPSKIRPRWPFVAVTALIVVAIAVGGGLWVTNTRARSQQRVVPLTTSAGFESCPSFSPDGTQVVFVWNGEKQANWNIYVKMIGSTTALQLTTDAVPDGCPAWSHDGRQIAYVKQRERTAIYLISPLGGPEQKVVDFEAAMFSAPAWSPNGKFIVAVKSSRGSPKAETDSGALFVIPLQGGEPRSFLIPDSGRNYRFPTFNPAGRSLAFASCREIGLGCEIFLVALNADFLPQGSPRQISSVAADIAGVAWTADGRSLVYSAGTSINDYYLWRLDMVTMQPSRLEEASAGAMFPSVAQGSGRLAFVRQSNDQDVWQLAVGGKSEPFLASSMLDLNAQFSPDGRRIAFASGRSIDRVAIWLCDGDGANPIQLTRGPGTYDGSPRWSPDGHWIAFDSVGSDGQRRVYLVEPAGGNPRKLASDFRWTNKVPSWSRDGKWVYFTSDRTGRWEIWRIPVQGGMAEQITTNGGYVALESADGKSLYYTKTGSYGGEPLYVRRFSGTEETQVLEHVAGRAFDLLADGIYYAASSGPRTAEIRVHEFRTGRNRIVSAIEGLPGLGLSVSPDGSRVLFTKFVSAGTDLMLLEDFR
jgi:serine/threonine protein kinase/WD40 repeat protein